MAKDAPDWVQDLLQSDPEQATAALIENAEYIWMIEVVLIILATLAASYFARRFFKRLEIKLAKTQSPWDDALLFALTKPLTIFIWVIGFSFALEVTEKAVQQVLLGFYEPIRDVAIIVLIAWALWRFAIQAEQNLLNPEMERKPWDATTVHAIGKLARASIFITTSLIVLQYFGYSVSGVLAFGGIGGIAVGFAAKDLLANFFGGLMIYLDRPFRVGDWVRSPDRDIEGTIEDIGWRLTIIRTFDKRPLYVPNSMFANISVENPSRMTNRRIKETIGIRYEDIQHMPAIIEKVTEFLRLHPDIDQDKTLIVNFNQFAPSSLDFFIYTFTKTTNWVEFHGIKQRILLGISDIILAEGADIAFPTSTIHLYPPDALSTSPNSAKTDYV